MRKFAFALWLMLFAVLSVSAYAAESNEPLLWKIEGTKAHYLFGTIHVPDPRVTELPASVKQAFASSKFVATELELDTSTLIAMANASMLPVGQSLSTQLPSSLKADVEAELKHISPQLNLAMFDRMKIWALATNLQLLPITLKYPGVPSLDIKLAQDAQKQGKKNIGIETLDEQVSILDGLTKAEQIALMEESVKQAKTNREANINLLEIMIQAYIKGDEKKIVDITNEGFNANDPLAQRLKKQLIDDRNIIMATRIHEMVLSNVDKSHFFAVGAAHLVGEGSVVELLRKKGLSIVRVTSD